jgi:hypothetical protein
MRKLAIILSFLPILCFAQGYVDSEELNLLSPQFVETMNQLVMVVTTGNLNPAEEIETRCFDGKVSTIQGNDCINNKVKTEHCSDKIIGDSYCFNGNLVKKSYNKLMMTFLCTDTDYTVPQEVSSHFGTCNPEVDKDILVVENKLSCSCETKVGGNGWVCGVSGILLEE